MAATLQRITKAFAVHLLLLIAALGVVYLAVHGQESLSAAVRTQYEGQAEEVMLQMVADARGRIMFWCLTIFITSWLASAVFLAVAERTQPTNIVQAASRRGLWSGLFILLVVIAGVLTWIPMFAREVSSDLASGSFTASLVAGSFLTLLAFYLATALAVKAAMRPSVPGATALPDFWS